jgi:hypothetical protein
MSKLLFSFTKREDAHTKLAEIISTYPLAECRENPNSAQPYQVWDWPEEKS